MKFLQYLNFWLVILLVILFLAAAVYCQANGVVCWAASGFASFFILFAAVLAARIDHR